MKKRMAFWVFGMVAIFSALAQNHYEHTVTVPHYDPDDTTMVLIDSDEAWSHINDETKTYFFVAPGDYTALGVIKISTPGKEDAPRYLVYYDPENPTDLSSHPVDMPAGKRAEIERLQFNGGFWVVDRLYGTATEGSKNPTFELRKSNIIVNRVLCEGGGGGAGQVAIQGSEIVVQNSVLRNTQIIPNNDIHAIKVSEGVDVSIVNNEIYNFAGDGVQLGDKTETFKGMVIYNNDFYIEPLLYPEEVDEIPHENAIDIKQAGVPGSEKHYVIIKNNRFKNIAHTPGGTSPNPDQGTIDFSNKNELKTHVLVEGNVFYNCKIPFNTKGGGALTNFTFTKNLVYNATRFGVWLTGEVSGHEVTYNTIIGVSEFDGDQKWIESESEQLEVYGNLIIDGGGNALPSGGYEADYNVFYNTMATPEEGDNSLVLETFETENFEEYCYAFKMHTGEETLCVPSARPKQSASFTYLTSGVYFGANEGIGVNDIPYNQDWCGSLYPAAVTGFPGIAFTNLSQKDTIRGAVDLHLKVSDTNEDIAAVKLILDGSPLAENLSAPYAYSWNTHQHSDGWYRLKASAVDQAGNVTYTQAIKLFVDNEPEFMPTITLDSPAHGEEVANDVVLSATAEDADGNLEGVQFYVDGEPLGIERFVAPFERIWHTQTVPDGAYEVWAVTRDMAGNEAKSTVAKVTVNNSYPPQVALLGIKSDTLLSGVITLVAEASDRDDDITEVSFLAGEDTIGIAYDAPYSYDWDTSFFPNGDYKLVAVANDLDGNQVPSRAVYVTLFNTVLKTNNPTVAPEYSVVPNPVKHAFHLDMKKNSAPVWYTLFAPSGQVIQQGTYNAARGIDMSQTRPGLYLLKLKNPSGGSDTLRVMKTND